MKNVLFAFAVALLVSAPAFAAHELTDAEMGKISSSPPINLAGPSLLWQMLDRRIDTMQLRK